MEHIGTSKTRAINSLLKSSVALLNVIRVLNARSLNWRFLLQFSEIAPGSDRLRLEWAREAVRRIRVVWLRLCETPKQFMLSVLVREACNEAVRRGLSSRSGRLVSSAPRGFCRRKQSAPQSMPSLRCWIYASSASRASIPRRPGARAIIRRSF